LIRKPPPRDPDDLALEELDIERSDLGLDLDLDHFDDDRIAERKEIERQRKEDAAEAKREMLEQEWRDRERRMRDALHHIVRKLDQ
jgi:hypothetical protein